MTTWLSAYFRFPNLLYGAPGDAAVHAFVRPVVERCRADGLIDAAFFIRYSEDGPHIRLRLLPAVPARASSIVDIVTSHYGTLLRGSLIAPEPASSLSWIDYEPEIARYGGPDAMPIAERMFDASSTYALRRISDAVSTDRSRRLGEGLLAMVLALRAFGGSRERARMWMSYYGSGYLTTVVSEPQIRARLLDAFSKSQERQADTMCALVQAMWEQQDVDDGAADADIRTFAEALMACCGALEDLTQNGKVIVRGETAGDWPTAATAIGSSFVHMMNNRLGVTITEEAYLAFVLQRALK